MLEILLIIILSPLVILCGIISIALVWGILYSIISGAIKELKKCKKE